MLERIKLFLIILLLFPLSVFADSSGSNHASRIRTDVTDFDTNLSAADTDVQKALETLDELVAGGGTPAGADTQVQYNDGGAFAGESTFTYTKGTNTLSIDRIVIGPGVADYAMPTTRGAADQVLRDNGGGAVSWWTIINLGPANFQPNADFGDINTGAGGDLRFGADSIDASFINTINCGTNCTWDTTNDEVDVDDAFVINSGADEMAGALTCDGIVMDDNHTIGWGGDESITFDGTDFQITDSLDFGTNILTDAMVAYILDWSSSVGTIHIDNYIENVIDTLAATLGAGADANDVPTTSWAKMDFFDAAIYIDGSTDGFLDIVADNLRLQPTATGDIACFSVTDVGDAVSGFEFGIERRAAEGDRYGHFFINEDMDFRIHTDCSYWYLDAGVINTVDAYFVVNDNLYVGHEWAGDGFVYNFRVYSFPTGESMTYVNLALDDATDTYNWTRESAEVVAMDFQLPLIADALTMSGTLIVDGNTVNLSDTTDEYVLAFDTGTQTWRGILSAAGATAYDDIGDPDANGSIDLGAYTGTYTSATDGWGGLIISNTAADNASDTTLLTLAFTDDGDTNSKFIVCKDAAGTQQWEVSMNGAILILDGADDLWFQPSATGDVEFFTVTDVADGADGQSLYIQRKAAEGDVYLRLYVNDDTEGIINVNDKLNFQADSFNFNNNALFQAEVQVLNSACAVYGEEQNNTELCFKDDNVTATLSELVNGQDHKALRVIHVNDEDVDIDAEILQVGRYSLTSVNLTILTDAANGINALDTGSMANSTWYYSWVIYNNTTDTVAGLASLSATAPTMPAGYNYKRRVCSFRTDGTADIIDFHMDAYGLVYYDTHYQFISGGTATTYTAVDMTTYMPPTSTVFLAHMANRDDDGVSAEAMLRATGDTDWQGYVQTTAIGTTYLSVYSHVQCPTNTSQSVDYKMAADDQNVTAYMHAYYDNL